MRYRLEARQAHFRAALLPVLSILVALSTRGHTQSEVFRIKGGDYNFALAIDSAGDVNRDGFDDIIAGHARFGSYRGRATIYSGKDGAVLRTFTGTAINQRVGFSVAGAGDVNADGYADVIVGAPGQTTGNATVYSGRDGRPIWVFRGLSSREFGVSVDGPGDLNGDGYDDLVIGAPERTGSRVFGQVNIRSGRDGKSLYNFFGSTSVNKFGRQVSGAGDVDADGRPDVMISRTFGREVDIVSGRTGRVLRRIAVAVSDRNGARVDGIGDVNGDGHADYVIGTPEHLARNGRVTVYSGRTGAVLWRRSGTQASNRLGQCVAATEDVDGDGVGDVLVGEPHFGATSSRHGRVLLLSGGSGRVIRSFLGARSAPVGYAVAPAGDVNCDGSSDFMLTESHPLLLPAVLRVHSGFEVPTFPVRFTRRGEGENHRHGTSVGLAGDVDGDGVHDFLVGAPHSSLRANGGGSVHVYSGRTGAQIRRSDRTVSFSFRGFSVAGIGDFDGDGFADYAAGAPGSPLIRNQGTVSVYSGRTGRLTYTIVGERNGDGFGYALARTGDANRDGVDDFVVGARYGSYAHLRSGRDGRLIHRFARTAATAFGTAVAGGGDVNGDGVDDVLVGAPLDGSRGVSAGAAFVFSGRDGRLLRSLYGLRARDQFGSSVAILGDVFGTGRADVVVGSPRASHAGLSSGRVRLFAGATGRVVRTFYGASTHDLFGWSVAAAGDVNGNGTPDVIIGAPQSAVLTKAGKGYARVYDGRDGELLFVGVGRRRGSHFGSAVAAAGDFDRDGDADVVVGAPREDLTFVRAGVARVFDAKCKPDRPTFFPFGAGCEDANGSRLRIGIDGRATLAGRFDMTLRAAPRSAPVFLRLGIQKARISLDAIGMRGCTALVLPIVDLPHATDPDGVASMRFPVSSDARFVGATLVFQWFAFDPRANSLGLVASDGGEVRIGRP